MVVNVLTIAESDSSGIKGIQADVKTITALGGYAATAVTFVLANNTKGLQAIKVLEPDFVAQQVRSVVEDFKLDAIKVGALFDRDIVNAVADVLDEYVSLDIPLIVDPNMVGHCGKTFMDEGAIGALKRRLFLRTKVLTPNLIEAEAITGKPIKDVDDMRYTADLLRTLGVENVVLKSEHAVNKKLVYFVATEGEERIYEDERLEGKGALGAGCVLSSAITISIAEGMDVFSSIERGIDYVHTSIAGSAYNSIECPVSFNFNSKDRVKYFNLIEKRVTRE